MDTSRWAVFVTVALLLLTPSTVANPRKIHRKQKQQQRLLQLSASTRAVDVASHVDSACNVSSEVKSEYMGVERARDSTDKRVRKNILHMSADEQEELMLAFMALKNEKCEPPEGHDLSEDQAGAQWNTYDKITWHHWDAFKNSIIHSGAIILPWHRSMLNMIEKELQRVSGNPDLAIPYWDWSDKDTQMDIFVPSLMSGNGTEHGRVYDGYIGSWSTKIADGFIVNDHIVRKYGRNPNSTSADATPPGVNNSASAQNLRSVSTTIVEFLPGAGEVLTALDDCYGIIDDIQCLHGMVHLWMGGDFPTSSAPNDPVFYLHHAYVDKLWTVWQEAHSYLPDWGYVDDIDTNLYWLGDYMADVLDWTQQEYVYEETDMIDLKFHKLCKTGYGAAPIHCAKTGPSVDAAHPGV